MTILTHKFTQMLQTPWLSCESDTRDPPLLPVLQSQLPLSHWLREESRPAIGTSPAPSEHHPFWRPDEQPIPPCACHVWGRESSSAKWWFSLLMIWGFWGPGVQTSWQSSVRVSWNLYTPARNHCESHSENILLCNWNEIFQDMNSQTFFPCRITNEYVICNFGETNLRKIFSCNWTVIFEEINSKIKKYACNLSAWSVNCVFALFCRTGDVRAI